MKPPGTESAERIPSANRAEAIYEIAKAINSVLDQDILLNRIIETAVGTLGAERGVLFLADSRTGELELQVAHNMTSQAVKDATSIGESILKEARRGGVALISQRRQTATSVRSPDIFSLMCIPLKLKDHIIGCIYIDSRVSTKKFVEEDLAFAEAFANLAAVSIENAHLFKREQARIARLGLVNEVGREISSSLKIEEVLQSAARLTVEALGYYFVNILLLDSGRNELVHRSSYGYPSRSLKGLRLKIGEPGITTWAASNGKPLLVNDVTKDERYLHVKELGDTKSELAIPIKSRGGVVGVLDVESDQLDAFHEDDLSTLQVVADQLAAAIENAQLHEKLRSENIELRQEIREKFHLSNIVGTSSAMQKVFATLESAARTSSNVLIVGESGTGKELVAKAIHYASARRERRFVPVDCGALPSQLLESELFGHKRGAFTGAASDKPGLFEEADGGTIFLDEITNMSESLQARLLRVVQEGEIRRLGETRERKVDVRIIAATNRDPRKEMEEGRMREDLYYRLDVITINIPPLRERGDDIPLLGNYFLTKHNASLKRKRSGFASDAQGVLVRYDWPGNVRELENEIERIVALGSDAGQIQVDEISERIRPSGEEAHSAFADREGKTAAPDSLRSHRERTEKARIVAALQAEDWRIERAARRLDISRQWLRKRMNRFGISRPDRRPEV
jgi:Nif-specific regulatory protein